MERGIAGASSLAAIKTLAWDHPGAEHLTIVVPTRSGERRLELGGAWSYSGDEQCMAALSEFGQPSFAGAWPLLRAELLALHIFEEVVLFGSAPMLLAGLRDSIGDIDLFATPGACTRLFERGWARRMPDPAHPPYLERFGLGEGLTVHAFFSWRGDEPIIDAWEALCERETVAGWPCVPLGLLLKHKRAAIAYSAPDPPLAKHLSDAAVIEEFLRDAGPGNSVSVR